MRRTRISTAAAVLALLGSLVQLPVDSPASAQTDPICFGRAPTKRGTAGPDRLRGTINADVIVGLGGDDRIDGLAGDDRVCGGAGDDTLMAGYDSDRLDGEGGRDTVVYESGPARVMLTDPGWANHGFVGQAPYGTDVLRGIENMVGSTSADSVSGGAARNRIDLGAGDDSYYYTAQDRGVDVIDGGLGVDNLMLMRSPAATDVDLQAGTLSGPAGSDQIANFESAYGSFFDDTISGDDGSNTLTGSWDAYFAHGDDTLEGRGGNDFLEGSRGDTTITGGDGDDTIRDGYFGSDVISGDNHNDDIDAQEQFHIAETGTYDPADMGTDQLNGGSGDDRISGSAGNDTMTGGDGNDGLAGRGGHDSLDGGPGTDSLNGGWGMDTCEGGESNDFCATGDIDDYQTLDQPRPAAPRADLRIELLSTPQPGADHRRFDLRLINDGPTETRGRFYGWVDAEVDSSQTNASVRCNFQPLPSLGGSGTTCDFQLDAGVPVDVQIQTTGRVFGPDQVLFALFEVAGGPPGTDAGPTIDPDPANNVVVSGSAGPGGVQCQTKGTGGYFEPVQGVWQDDAPLPGSIPRDVKWFADRPGKRLVKLDPVGNEAALYRAELPMVKDRPTVLFGIDHAAGDKPIEPDDRFNIVITGRTDCQDRENVATVKFTLTQGGATTDIAVTPEIAGFPSGPPGRSRRFTIKIPVPRGFPLPSGSGDTTFTFPSTGDYLIRGEVLAEGDPTGIFVDVTGTVVETDIPKVAFLPLLLTRHTEEAQQKLRTDTARLASDSAKFIPDLFPIEPGGFPAVTLLQRDLSTAITDVWLEWRQWVLALGDIKDRQSVMSQTRLAAVDRHLSTAAQMSPGTSKVVVVMPSDDFFLMLPEGAENKVAGLTSSSKFIAMPHSITAFNKTFRMKWDTVAHEYAHSVPRFLWSEGEMRAECGLNYHNEEVNTGNGDAPLRIAHGFRLRQGGEPVRILRSPDLSIMGGGLRGNRWIDQCTYRHLIEALQQPLDPPTLLVQGRLARSATDQIGELFPLYQLDGVPELEAGPGGNYAVVARDATGAELARYPFVPQWKLDTGLRRNVLFFSYRLPDDPAIASVELVGPEGVLHTRTYSAAAPQVTITSPLAGQTVTPSDDTVPVSWVGTDTDGDELLYTVAYSSDGGETWIVQSVEQTAPTFDVALDAATEHMVRITATDGARSTSAEVTFSSP